MRTGPTRLWRGLPSSVAASSCSAATTTRSRSSTMPSTSPTCPTGASCASRYRCSTTASACGGGWRSSTPPSRATRDGPAITSDASRRLPGPLRARTGVASAMPRRVFIDAQPLLEFALAVLTGLASGSVSPDLHDLPRARSQVAGALPAQGEADYSPCIHTCAYRQDVSARHGLHDQIPLAQGAPAGCLRGARGWPRHHPTR